VREPPPDDTTLHARDRIVLSLALYAAVMSLYFAAGSMARAPWWTARTALDDAVPFRTLGMVGYALVYLVPFSLLWVETTWGGVRRMMRAALLAYALAAPVFVALPVIDADPPLTPVTWSDALLEWNRAADESQNLFPSMHVGLATLLALVGARRSKAWAWALGGSAVVIAASTLLVKQHYLVDLPAGAAVGWLAFRTVYGPPLRRPWRLA
jgi:membrane-associated phospholipid phosphatase